MAELLNMRAIDRLVTSGGKFLRAVSTRPAIRELLIGLGYSDAEHREGWRLYLKMLGYVGGTSGPTGVQTVAPDRVNAMNRIDRFDEPAFRRASAALDRLHPDQHKYLFANGLSAKSGPESVGSVLTFIDRYAALRDGTDPTRAGKRKADKAAAITLETRNIINPAIEKELRALIELAQSLAPAAETDLSVPESVLQDAAIEFQSWLRDWRTTASVGISRRDYRIMLGISRRRSAADASDEDDGSQDTDSDSEDTGDSTDSSSGEDGNDAVGAADPPASASR